MNSAPEIARLIANDLAERVQSSYIKDDVLDDLTPFMLAMQICDLLLVEALDASAYYFMRPEDDPLRLMADQIAAETLAAWPVV